MLALIFAFIGLVALAKGKLKVTANRELSAWRARAIGLGFLAIACLLQVTAGASDDDLRARFAEQTTRRGYASALLTDVNDVRFLLITLAVGAGFVLTLGALLLAQEVGPGKASQARKGASFAPTLAARSLRLWCWLLDCALVLAPAFVLHGIATLMGRDTPADIERILPIIGLSSTAIYALQCWLTASSGQSLAKGWFGIRVVRPTGAPPGVFRGVVLRSWVPAAAAALSLVWPFFAFATLCNVLQIFGGQSRCIHDLLADTIVVNVAERPSSARVGSEA